MDKEFTIEVTCLFCDAPLKVEEGKEYKSGDMIKCSECGEMNDHDAVLDVAKQKGIELVKDEVIGDLKSSFKKLFK